jgi:DNA-binding CsgD family transcriptional regulator
MSSEPDPSKLTPREAEVLDLMAEGMTTRDIAAQLGVSARTVGRSITLIYEKLGASTRLDAVHRILRSDEDFEVRLKLRRLPTADRQLLLRWLAADRGERESIASQVLKRRTQAGDVLAECVAMLTSHPEQHQRFVRLLRQIDGDSA